MEEIDLIEFSAMIIALIAIVNIPFIIKRRKDFIKYVPGIVSLILFFIAGNLDDFFKYEVFDIIENACILLGAILLLMASLMDLNETISWKKISRKSKFVKKEDDG
ncbi:MAG: hypothetical protein ACFFAN_04460 [Promethearchaeota archaeon]